MFAMCDVAKVASVAFGLRDFVAECSHATHTDHKLKTQKPWLTRVFGS